MQPEITVTITNLKKNSNLSKYQQPKKKYIKYTQTTKTSVKPLKFPHRYIKIFSQ